MFRLLILIHRYLGIALGVIVALWCLSGFVMMYVQYPDVSEREYLAGLPLIDASACCIANEDVLGQLDGVDEPPANRCFARDSAVTWASWSTSRRAGGSRPLIRRLPCCRQMHSRDQWTVAGYFDAYRPLYQFAADDDAGTQLYISSVNGQLIQATSFSERFWNWFGAVTHWIYPTALRQNTALWSQVVIWLTIASLFLVVVGIYLGIVQYGRRANGSKSPYEGLNLWHHYSGLIFGLVTVTWLFSGLLSMNPWGAFEGDSGFEERSRLQGGAVSSAGLSNIVAALGDSALPHGTVQLRSSMIDGKLALIAKDSAGRATRLHRSTLQPEPLPEDIWNRVSSLVRPDVPVRQAGVLDSGDNFYFSHHEEVSFPVYRIEFDDTEQTRYYGANPVLLRYKVSRADSESRQRQALEPLVVPWTAPRRFHVADAPATALGPDPAAVDDRCDHWRHHRRMDGIPASDKIDTCSFLHSLRYNSRFDWRLPWRQASRNNR
jgi:hypothetical protein